MSRIKNDRYETITTPSEEVVRAYRKSREQGNGEASIAVVHYRGGQTEFDLGRTYGLSSDPLDRVTGADVLSQLGWGEDCFHDESVELLVHLATDGDDRVMAAAAIALGHRRSTRGIPVILPLIQNPNAVVRLAAVHGLTGQVDPAAIQGLIQLAGDEDRDVRDWAAFGLGSNSDLDTVELRDALAPLLNDADAEVRGEALIGLAKRHDPRVLPALMRELQGEFYGAWCVEAAEFLGDAQLVPFLTRMRDSLQGEDVRQFASYFDHVIASCTK